jgi:hypothetical protein
LAIDWEAKKARQTNSKKQTSEAHSVEERVFSHSRPSQNRFFKNRKYQPERRNKPDRLGRASRQESDVALVSRSGKFQAGKVSLDFFGWRGCRGQFDKSELERNWKLSGAISR